MIAFHQNQLSNDDGKLLLLLNVRTLPFLVFDAEV
jgi:hypothetical protein